MQRHVNSGCIIIESISILSISLALQIRARTDSCSNVKNEHRDKAVARRGSPGWVTHRSVIFSGIVSPSTDVVTVGGVGMDHEGVGARRADGAPRLVDFPLTWLGRGRGGAVGKGRAGPAGG